MEENSYIGVYVTRPYGKITMPCGHEETYEKPADLPKENVPCPCGDRKHWLVYYEGTKDG